MSAGDFRRKPNILIIITDQEREVMHWPEGWAEANLPSRTRLLQNGLQFTRAQCNTAACSSSRATFFTGLYPAQHGVKNLVNLASPSDARQRRTTMLSSNLPNLAKVMADAGYHVVLKGKLHLTRPVNYDPAKKRHDWSGADVTQLEEKYGFHGWNPPDMSDPMNLSDLGGGTIGYIAVTGFSDNSQTKFHDALQADLKAGKKKLILDLRGDPGGYVTAARSIVSEFIKDGPIFWEQDADGSKWFVFGYMNRNWVEEINLPTGTDNSIMPGGPDQGQPTHFMPRRNRFVFRVAVPKNFTEKDELIWTLTAHGVTEKAWATLRPDYLLDNVVKASETGALGAGSSSPVLPAPTP